MTNQKANSFKKMALSPEILANLDSLGYVTMTPIQQQGLPFILDNRDFIGQANTGSGKTAVFALGILSKLDPENRHPQAIVIVPTRELAQQVAREVRMLARCSPNIKVITLCGGSQERHAVKSLEQGAHIIVGTPGRLIKFLEKGTLNPTSLTTLVLDEADRLLEMGFIEEVHAIAAFYRCAHQTMLFSATLPNGIRALCEGLLEDPAQVTVDSQHQSNSIGQIFYKAGEDKNGLLLRVLAHYQPESCLIFCNSQEDCHKVNNWLKRNKMQALPMHSGLEQQERTLTMIKFANKSVRILVATDLASRGIDVKDVGMVINYDMPSDHQMYVHRIGRTGRAGREGLAVSFYTPQERPVFMAIGEYLKKECRMRDVETLLPYKPLTLQASMATIYISGGKKNNIRPGDILGALTKDAGLEGKEVGQINVLDVNSYVAIALDKRDHAIAHFVSGKIKGKKFKVGKA